jgi:uncharacterized protein YcfJ
MSGDLLEFEMEINQPSSRIHPLMAGAAVSVMLVSLVGVAAITGVLPNSHGTAAPAAAAVAAPAAPAADDRIGAAPVQYSAPAVQRRQVVHAAPARPRPAVYAQAEPVRQYSPAPVYQQPAPVAQNSPVGIGVGAVVGGLIGSQVGGGNGRTLATIAGAVGGGYVGNEIAKRNR